MSLLPKEPVNGFSVTDVLLGLVTETGFLAELVSSWAKQTGVDTQGCAKVRVIVEGEPLRTMRPAPSLPEIAAEPETGLVTECALTAATVADGPTGVELLAGELPGLDPVGSRGLVRGLCLAGQKRNSQGGGYSQPQAREDQ